MSAVADEIWAILHGIAQSQKETDRILKESSEERKETERILKELSEDRKETDRILKELLEDRKELSEDRKETDRILKELSEDRKELSENRKETERELKSLSREVKSVSTSVGRLGNRLGEFVEEAVRPSAVRLFRERGIDVHEVHQNITAKRDGDVLEIDLLVVNNNDVIAIECKSNLGIDDVNDHLERLEKIKRLLPDHKNKRISGAVAGMVIPENIAMYAIRKGLYVIGQNGEHWELQNDMSFKAKIW